MKTITLALLASAAAAFAATSARADTRFSVGVNVGGPAYAPPLPPPVVVHTPPPAPRGYWKDVTVKTWVPERWVTSRDRWGRPVRVCEPGYFTYRTDRVWVDGRDDRGPRGYAYGYDNNRHDNDRYDNNRHDNRGWNR